MSPPKGRLFVVDGNWYLHRIFHTQSFESKDPGKTMASRFLSLVCKDALAVKARRVLVAFDGSQVFRYRLFTGYKAGRKNHDEGPDLLHNKEGMVAGPYTYLSNVLSFVSEAGIANCQFSKYEADDVLCSAAHQFEDVVLGTKDKDSYQSLIRDDVVLYDSTHQVDKKPSPRTIRRNGVEAVFGVRADQALDLQTITGDSIDGIPQLVSRAKALKGIKQWDTLKNWIANDPEFRSHLSKHKAELMLNRKLVRLKSDIKLEVAPIKWSTSKDMPSAYVQFKDFCNPKSRGLF
jgi:5'-3' exonuclease